MSAGAEKINGCLTRPPVIVDDWKAFHAWGNEAGYDESYFNQYDSKCLALQEQYLQELADQKEENGDAPPA